MKSFEYLIPYDIKDLCKLLEDFGPDIKILAGGTDLLIEMRKPSAQSPKVIVDMSRLPDLKGIEEFDKFIRIKPLTTHTEILQSNIIQQFAPILRQAVLTIGSPQIRNRGTIGGNIMNAAACADTVPPLMALGAELKLRSAEGERIIPIMDFFNKPYHTVALRHEVLTEIKFPKLPNAAKSAFIKLGRRNALAISRLSVAVILRTDSNDVIEGACIVPGAAFPTWQRVKEAEIILIGKKSSKEIFAEAGRKVSEVMISFTGRRWSTEYKEPVVAVLVRRALEACQGG
jgi:CO/xanthine dehydrogenase FAD-binding subunit